MSEPGRGPGVPYPPPLIFATAFLVAWLLDRYVVHLWPELTIGVAGTVRVLGWVLVVAGLAFAYWGIATFLRRRTAVYPNRDASTLVIEGPYRFTRNPMYSGMAVAYIGGACIVSSLWPILLLPVALMALVRFVIAREERYLTEAFGDQYLEYRRRVRRWI
jgi:protein-S-isoprenylcysteine O-methyltransferase Ste14